MLRKARLAATVTSMQQGNLQLTLYNYKMAPQCIDLQMPMLGCHSEKKAYVVSAFGIKFVNQWRRETVPRRMKGPKLIEDRYR